MYFSWTSSCAQKAREKQYIRYAKNEGCLSFPRTHSTTSYLILNISIKVDVMFFKCFTIGALNIQYITYFYSIQIFIIREAYVHYSQKRFARCFMLAFRQFFYGLIEKLDKCGFLRAKEEFAIPLGICYHLRK